MRRPWQVGPVLLGCGFGVVLTIGAAGRAPAAERIAQTAATERSSHEANGPIRASLDRIDIVSPGASDRRSLKSARAALPLGRLTQESRRRAEAVLDNLSMFREMPTLRLEVDHDAYRYFVEHPDVAVSLWRALGVSKCQLWQTGPDAYETDVGDGSTGIIDVLLRSDSDHLVIGEGQFKSPLLVKPIRANALLHLRTEYVVRPDGEPEAICRGFLYVAFPSQTVEAAAKVISPMTNMVIDRNFEEIGLFVHMMSLAMRNQPGWVENLAGRLDGVLERRGTELLEVTAKAYVADKKRELAREGRPISAEAILPPLRTDVAPTSR